MSKLIVKLKKIFRNFYYFFYNNKVVNITHPPILSGNKWIINKDYGRAYYKGYYEPAIIHVLINHLHKDSVFMDIGAHAGYFSLIAAQITKNGRVISFEPMKQNFDFIKKTKKINDIKNWDIHHAAISNSTGTTGFISGKTSSTGVIVENNPGEVIVNTITLDKFIENHSIYPDLIKIDVEGHGDKVLHGFSLLRNYPKEIQILFEIHTNSNEIDYLVNNISSTDFFIRDLNDIIIDLKTDKIPNHIIISNKKP